MAKGADIAGGRERENLMKENKCLELEHRGGLKQVKFCCIILSSKFGVATDTGMKTEE